MRSLVFMALAACVAACTTGDRAQPAPERAPPGRASSAVHIEHRASLVETEDDGTPAVTDEGGSDSPDPGRAPPPGREPAPQACLESWPALPADLPDDARECLAPLFERRAELATMLFEPRSAGAVPCALESLDEAGVVLETGKVERFTARERSLRYKHVDPDDSDNRMVQNLRIRFDRVGREKSRQEHDAQFLFDPKLPDCENFVDTNHRYDGEGRPKFSKKVISTCEGVDAGTITRRRSFRRHDGWVGARVAVVDRGSVAEATETWLPDPTNPLAHVECELEECRCEVVLRSCDGVELGRAKGGRRGGLERWAWDCPVTGG